MLTDCLYYFFFFSSRRRHTRWPRDWSSDVCSSDLLFSGFDPETGQYDPSTWAYAEAEGGARSEERRVGKEGRTQWAAANEKKDEEIEDEMAAKKKIEREK